MAWERRRNGRLYYYRARSVKGRIIKEYVGTGPEAEQAAREDAEKRAQREARVQRKRQRRQEYEAAQLALAALGTECQNLVRASLLSAGYHQHDRGKWRKRRADRNSEERPERPPG
jgi:hypothetical protein